MATLLWFPCICLPCPQSLCDLSAAGSFFSPGSHCAQPLPSRNAMFYVKQLEEEAWYMTWFLEPLPIPFLSCGLSVFFKAFETFLSCLDVYPPWTLSRTCPAEQRLFSGVAWKWFPFTYWPIKHKHISSLLTSVWRTVVFKEKNYNIQKYSQKIGKKKMYILLIGKSDHWGWFNKGIKAVHLANKVNR